MNIGCFTDCHWSLYSSIIKGFGEKFPLRIENLIKSINFAERQFEEKGCELVVCAGDFFDTPQLGPTEITALKEIKWADIPHIFVVGNHEMGTSNLDVSSTHIFTLLPNAEVVDKPKVIDCGDYDIGFLPYFLESNKLKIGELLGEKTKRRIIFSHNDIAGIQMGEFLSVDGFEIKDIESNCELFVNGHLHNGCWVTHNILNLGNLTGQNFSEDALRYTHNLAIINTDNLKVQLIENPNAFNFYKVGEDIIRVISRIKPNAIVSCSASYSKYNQVKELLESNENIIEYRLMLDKSDDDIDNEVDSIEEITAVDHLEQFKEYVFANIGTSPIVMEELNEVVQ